MGIVASSRVGLLTGLGFDYFAALHVVATAWCSIAVQMGKQFKL